MTGGTKNEELGAIAVIGMACRFPGAANLDAYWENLRNGVESIRHFTAEELEEIGDFVNHPSYVGAQGYLEGIDQFDAAFFGLTPKEAEVMDPQQRFFLECGWHALEHGGYDPATYEGNIGVFGGCDTSHYLHYLRMAPGVAETVGEFQLLIGNAQDHIAPRLSYMLNLRGPSVPIQTACSTSLVAVHIACQSLINFESDMALAGGVSIPIPQKTGYLFAEGGTFSPDGFCRAFDSKATGTAPGSGVGLVLLKRLDDALAAGDTIYAVIRGSAINNDGSAKVGYTAPSIEGQKRVLMEAHGLAGIAPGDLSYIETHGTATTLGDPIEVEALRQAFGEDAALRGTCALGSVKTNLGHCNSAAGVAGLIKTVLCLHHQTLVPSLHFEAPNPKLDLPNSPFYVNTETRSWEGADRFAGVSSFGIGGTNAHVVLSAAPATDNGEGGRPLHLLTLAAKTSASLETKRAQLGEFLDANPTTDPADLAFTLNRGRKAFDLRDCLVFTDIADLRQKLAKTGRANDIGGRDSKPSAVFLFPGQGSDYTNLGRDLYRHEHAFREEVDRCCRLLKPLLGDDLLTCLFAADDAGRAQLKQPKFWQPALFVVSYAQARLWMSWGIKPKAMMGHSIGEYVAATLAGVLTLEDALQLVAKRGLGTQDLDEGGMLAVIAEEDKVLPYVTGAISLAAVNGPILRVLSGPRAEIEKTQAALKQAGVETVALASTHAFHSVMMEPLMAPLTQLAKGFTLKEPTIPFISNVTGTWMTREDALDPGYWARHLRQAVQFNRGVEVLLGEPGRVFLEVGPGKVLSNLVNRHPSKQIPAIAAIPAPEADHESMLEALGRLWTEGLAIDWDEFYSEERRRRIPLPVYPFEHRSFWALGGVTLEAAAPTPTGPGGAYEKIDMDDWIYAPTWRQTPFSRPVHLPALLDPDDRWLIFLDEAGLAESMAARLQSLGQTVVRIKIGEAFDEIEGGYSLDPANPTHYEGLFSRLTARSLTPTKLIHALRLDSEPSSLEQLDSQLVRGFRSLIHISQSLAVHASHTTVRMGIFTNGAQQVTGEPVPFPDKAVLAGAARIIPKEIANIECKSIDIDLDDAGHTRVAIDHMLAELLLDGEDDTVAHTGRSRWTPEVSRIRWDDRDPQFQYRRGGVYLVTNGLQELGLALAERLASDGETTVVLLDRVFMPAESEWDEWLRDQGEEGLVSRNIMALRELRGKGGKVEVMTANLSDSGRMSAARDQARARFGAVHGVFHLFTPPDAGLIQMKPHDDTSRLLATKMRELYVLGEHFSDADFLVFFSENPGEYGFGQVEQSASYAFMGQYARHLEGKLGIPVVAVDWGTRDWVEPSGDGTPTAPAAVLAQLEEKRQRMGMTRAECLTLLERILTLGLAHVAVSTSDYSAILQEQKFLTAAAFQKQMSPAGGGEGGTAHPRPDMSTEYAPPTNEVEELIEDTWRTFFGLDKIGIHDNFFELGGHSLLAVQLLNRVNDTFAVKLTMNQLFDSPTIAEIAVVISGDSRDEDDAEDLAALLAEIEGLSEDDLKAALNEESGL